LLRRAVGADAADFRPGQWEAIDALVNQRRKLLIVERTGWGKSVFISSPPASCATGASGRR